MPPSGRAFCVSPRRCRAWTSHKLVKLAESVIAQKGLSPLDNILVLDKKPGDHGYVVLEGNRRVAVLKVLNNPSLMDDAKISKGSSAIESSSLCLPR
jgi:hypothetical protein